MPLRRPESSRDWWPSIRHPPKRRPDRILTRLRAVAGASIRRRTARTWRFAACRASHPGRRAPTRDGVYRLRNPTRPRNGCTATRLAPRWPGARWRGNRSQCREPKDRPATAIRASPDGLWRRTAHSPGGPRRATSPPFRRLRRGPARCRLHWDAGRNAIRSNSRSVAGGRAEPARWRPMGRPRRRLRKPWTKSRIDGG